MNLGQRICHAREARGWSQNELARRADLSQGFISDIEAGKRVNVGFVTLTKLAAAFDVTVSALITDAPDAAPVGEQEAVA